MTIEVGKQLAEVMETIATCAAWVAVAWFFFR